MRNITKYSRKMKWVYAKSAVVVCGLMVIAFPCFRKTESVSVENRKSTAYVVTLNGEELGAVKKENEADAALLTARANIEAESETSVYAGWELSVDKTDDTKVKTLTEEQLADKMTSVIKDSAVKVKEKAYVVNIEGFMVTLSSKEEVVQLLDATKSKYDKEGKYTTVLTDNGDSRFSSISYDFVNLNMEDKDSNMVSATANEENDETEKASDEEKKEADGLKSIAFSENVEIIETYVPSSQMNSVEEAIELVTKEKAEKKMYEVQEGDTLSSIGRAYGLSLDELLEMNTNYDEEGLINIGDRIVVTVPEPELSVVTVEQKTYKEKYYADVEYIYNDSQYTTYEAVIDEGTVGKRSVTANVTYVNGVETSREILEEEVIKESSPKIIEKGTIIPPTFIKPISGGFMTSGFEARWGSFHYGVDWACSTGTSVMASCSGTVVSAGWAGSYGYSIVLDHGNGVQTRYAHLSQILVEYGQFVNQGDVIAYSGSTGFSTGPHIHLEIIMDGVRVDPLGYIGQ